MTRLADPAGATSLTAQPTYGVDTEGSYVLSAWEMETVFSGGQWALDFAHTYRYMTNGFALFGNVRLPQGAVLTSVELEACDTSPTGEVKALMYRASDSGPVLLAELLTGEVTVPGCSRFSGFITPGEVVDNYGNVYLVQVNNTSYDGTATVGAVRIFYRLQVSPAPQNATFNDVPTSDPAFQFIEALVASGVTAGCGSGNYCPDAPLTRRQMAVFLSKSLGLHWPVGPAF